MKIHRHLWIIITCLSITLGILIFFGLFQEEKISYNQEIRPIFNAKCITCHGGVKKSGGFSLLFREEALDTTESGQPAIIPGHANESELMRRVRHHDPEMRMPLEAEPLSEKEIDLLRTWINQGALWEDHWAYIPPHENIPVPPTDQPGWAQNDIDPFVYARLQEKGLQPAPEAEKDVLLRRVSLDLTGLPPTWEERQQFLQDPAPDAYEKVVDRLLASPRFGEHWAAMWLDLARYADTKGYEKDLGRSIWQYRDWVIHAFNKDMPFDQFTMEQLAGDLLPHPTADQYIATAFHRNTIANDEGGTDDEEFRIAAVLDRVSTTWEVWQGTTMACVQCHSHPYDPIRHEEFYQAFAFFNNTQDRDIYNEQPKLFTYAEENEEQVATLINWIEDRLKTPPSNSSETLLHDHRNKLLYQLGYRKVEAEEFDKSSRFIELTPPDQESVWQIQDSSWILFRKVDLTDIEAISYRYASPYSGRIQVRLDSASGPVISQTRISHTGKPESEEAWSQWNTKKVSITPTAGVHDVYFTFGIDRHYTSDLFRLDWIFYHEKHPGWTSRGNHFQEQVMKLEQVPAIETPIMRERPPAEKRKTQVFTRGNWLTPGEEVVPSVPASTGSLPAASTPYNRLDLARWLVSPENPLTARVIVNRFWEKIFGFGLVETVEDFGTQGTPPSHPQLLDWLAVQFRDTHQWSVKKLLKQIVMSATYRQASHTTPEKLAQDPRNEWLSRGPRIRLSAEQIRDQALAVSGLLSSKMYGPSVRPPQPESVGDWGTSPGEDQYRRALYTFWHRTNPYPSFITFDSPGRNVCVSRRIRTNTPLQALVLLNDTVYFEAAQVLAEKMQAFDSESVTQRLREGYRMVMLREPSEEKLKSLEKLYQAAIQHYQQPTKPNSIAKPVSTRIKTTQVEVKDHTSPEFLALTLVANALLNVDEFITKN